MQFFITNGKLFERILPKTKDKKKPNTPRKSYVYKFYDKNDILNTKARRLVYSKINPKLQEELFYGLTKALASIRERAKSYEKNDPKWNNLGIVANHGQPVLYIGRRLTLTRKLEAEPDRITTTPPQENKERLKNDEDGSIYRNGEPAN